MSFQTGVSLHLNEKSWKPFQTPQLRQAIHLKRGHQYNRSQQQQLIIIMRLRNLLKKVMARSKHEDGEIISPIFCGENLMASGKWKH